MSKITLTPHASGTGTLNIAAPNTNSTRTLTLPDADLNLGNVLTTASDLVAAKLTGALPAISGAALTGIASPILQVVTFSDTFDLSTTSNSPVATSLTASITPSSATSKIIVMVTGVLAQISLINHEVDVTIYRDATNLAVPMPSIAFLFQSVIATGPRPCEMSIIDSPATTSSVAYTVYYWGEDSSYTAYLKSNSVTGANITLMEIAG